MPFSNIILLMLHEYDFVLMKMCGNFVCIILVVLSCVDLLKHTPELHPDHKSLVEVVEVIKSTLV